MAKMPGRGRPTVITTKGQSKLGGIILFTLPPKGRPKGMADACIIGKAQAIVATINKNTNQPVFLLFAAVMGFKKVCYWLGKFADRYAGHCLGKRRYYWRHWLENYNRLDRRGFHLRLRAKPNPSRRCTGVDRVPEHSK